MIQPVRPQDVSGLYRQQAASGSGAAGGVDRAGREGAAHGGRTHRRSDEVSLSDDARQLRRVLKALHDVPDVREERIAFLRDQIANGTYDIGALTIARRLVDEGHVA